VQPNNTMTKPTLTFVALFAFGICAGLLSCSRSPGPNTSTQPPTGMIGKSRLDPHWIYVSEDIRWELPPKDILKEGGAFYDGAGYLMILYPSGELAVVRCDLRKNGKTSQLSLNGVVSFSVATGTWSRNSDGTLTTVSRFCAAPMGLDRSNEPPVERRCSVGEQSSNRIGSLLRCDQESMVPLPDNFKDVEGISYMLTFAFQCA
jgi:hypothetical protein